MPTYPEITQIRTNISPHSVPHEFVASVFRMSSESFALCGSVSFVVVVWTLFGCEGEPADGFLEDRGGLHFLECRWILLSTRRNGMDVEFQ